MEWNFVTQLLRHRTHHKIKTTGLHYCLKNACRALGQQCISRESSRLSPPGTRAKMKGISKREISTQESACTKQPKTATTR